MSAQNTHTLTPEDVIAAALRRWPHLSANGFTDDRPRPLRPEEVATAVAFLQQCDPIRTPLISSYGLKHSAERWGEALGLSNYVSNGALIAAAHALGFPMGRPEGLNVRIGVSRRSLHKLEGHEPRKPGRGWDFGG